MYIVCIVSVHSKHAPSQENRHAAPTSIALSAVSSSVFGHHLGTRADPRPPADLRCYLCAETCGVLEAPPAATMPPVARFSATGGSLPRMLAWSALRCPRCRSGSLFLDEAAIVVRRFERVDWTLDQPRRGRPPRWLVALRAREDAA